MPLPADLVSTRAFAFHLPRLVNTTFYYLPPSQEIALHSISLTDPPNPTLLPLSLPPRTFTFTKKRTTSFSNLKPLSLTRAASSYAFFHFHSLWHVQSTLSVKQGKNNTSKKQFLQKIKIKTTSQGKFPLLFYVVLKSEQLYKVNIDKYINVGDSCLYW